MAVTGGSDHNWCLEPIIPGPWRDLVGDVALDLTARIAAAGSLRHWKRRVTKLRARPLDFYGNWLLVEAQVVDASGIVGVLALIYGDSGVLPLNGTSQVFHQINLTKLRLNAEADEFDYLRLFCSGTRAENGRFRVTESAADLRWQETAAVERPAAETALAPVRVLGRDEHSVRIEARVLYGNSLFKSHFRVFYHGLVAMEEEDELVSNLHLIPERFEGAIRLAVPGPTSQEG